MTTVDTMDTKGSIAQIRRLVEAGCEYVRLTAPSVKEAANLALFLASEAASYITGCAINMDGGLSQVV